MSRCRPVRHLLAVTVVAGVLAACTGDAGTDDGADDGTAAEGTVEEADDAVPSGRMLLSGFRDDNPGGVSVEVTSVEVDEGGHLLLGIDVVNTAVGGRVDIGQYRNVLVDDLGNYYDFQRVPENEWLTVPKDHRMSGTLAFEGPVDPAATHVTFALNQDAQEDRVSAVEDGRLDRTPRFLIEDLPLPGIGLEDEALNADALGVLETRTVEIGESSVSPDNPDVTVTIVTVELDGRTVEIDLEAVNGSGEAVELVTQRPTLRDDVGRRMEFIRSQSETQEERRLRLGPGDEASATFAFRGSPSAGAQELRLLTNSLSRNNPGSPTFEIVLPLPSIDE